MTCDEMRPLLNARMDDELTPQERASVSSHIETCASCASDVERLKSVRQAVRTGMPYYKAPPALKDQVRLALRGAEYLDAGSRRINWRVWGAVAASVVFCALASAPFLVNQRNRSELAAEEFVSAHQRALVGKSVDVVSSDHHTVKPWFNGKVPFSPPVTDLESEGFPLEGGRVDYAGDRPVAALVYRRHLHHIDVFVSLAAGRNAPPSHFARNGFNEISWRQGDFQFTAVSDLNEPELMSFTRLLQAR